jgi:DNA-binding XRE family transcriptional regulator
MQDDIALGRMVQEVRLFRNLRQKDVAERAGVGNDTVSRLERGLVDGMTVRALSSYQPRAGDAQHRWPGLASAGAGAVPRPAARRDGRTDGRASDRGRLGSRSGALLWSSPER